MTKTETIAKINAACSRVLKQADYAGGVVMALTNVVARLTALRDQIQAQTAMGEMDNNTRSALFEEVYECGRVLSSIDEGFPVVPAEDVATLNTTEGVEMVAARDVAKVAVEELEKAAATPEEASKRVATVKVALAAWGALGETDPDGATVPVIRDSAKLVELCKGFRVKRREAKKAAELAANPMLVPVTGTPDPSAEEQVIANLESIAKRSEEPAPFVPPAALPRYEDLNRKK